MLLDRGGGAFGGGDELVMEGVAMLLDGSCCARTGLQQAAVERADVLVERLNC